MTDASEVYVAGLDRSVESALVDLVARVESLERKVHGANDGGSAEPTVAVPRDLLDSLVDPDPCWFDHHGGCQAHGYLNLEPGQQCPQAELRAILARTEEGR